MMNEEDYNAGLEYLEKHAPNHPLMRAIARGYSKMNVLYLEKALSEVPPPKKKEVSVVDKDGNDPVVKRLNSSLIKAFGLRAKESNRFHVQSTDLERRAISQNIEHIQNGIEKLLKEKEYYLENGEIPKRIILEKYPVPADPVAQLKKRNSLHATMSQIRRELESLVGKHNKQDRIADLHKRLKEKEIYLKHVNSIIEKEAV